MLIRIALELSEKELQALERELSRAEPRASFRRPLIAQ